MSKGSKSSKPKGHSANKHNQAAQFKPSVVQMAERAKNNGESTVAESDSIQLKKNVLGEPAFFQPNASVQARLKMGSSGDKFEKEADSVADQVVQKSEAKEINQAPTPPIQTSKVNSGDLQRVEQPEEIQTKEKEEDAVQQVSEEIKSDATDMEETGDSLQLKEEEESIQKEEEDAAQKEPIQKQEVEEPVQSKEEITNDIDTETSAEVQAKEISNSEPHESSLSNTENSVQAKEVVPIAPLTPIAQAKATDESLQSKEEEEIVQNMEDEEKSLQMAGGGAGEDAGSIESDLNSSRGKGATMDKSTKSEMESGFGQDFSDVKIHTDSKAQEMSDNIGAQAFTSGNDIYFNSGKYNPSSKEGKHLLAHELTHTVQQGGGKGTIQRKEKKKKSDFAYAKAFYEAFTHRTGYIFGGTDENRILNILGFMSISRLVKIDKQYRKYYSPKRGQRGIMQELIHELGHDDIQKVMDLLANMKIGNAKELFHSNGTLKGSAINLSPNIFELRYHLNAVDIQEADVIAILRGLTPQERDYIIPRSYFRERLVASMNETEMIQVVVALQLPKPKALQWLRNYGRLNYRLIRVLIRSASPSEKKQFRTGPWRIFFDKRLGKKEFKRLVDDIELGIGRKIKWMIMSKKYKQAHKQLIKVVKEATVHEREEVLRNTSLLKEVRDELGKKKYKKFKSALYSKDEANARESNITLLKEFLGYTNIPEGIVIEYLRILTKKEKDQILNNPWAMQRLVSAMNTNEMIESMIELEASVDKQFKWIKKAVDYRSNREITYDQLKMLLVVANPSDREKLHKDHWRRYFLRIIKAEYSDKYFGVTSMSNVVGDLGMELEDQLTWLFKSYGDLTEYSYILHDKIAMASYYERQMVEYNPELWKKLTWAFRKTYDFTLEALFSHRFEPIGNDDPNIFASQEAFNANIGANPILWAKTGKNYFNTTAKFKASKGSMDAIAKDLARGGNGFGGSPEGARFSSSFFTSKGDPYVGAGVGGADGVTLEAKIHVPKDAITFNESFYLDFAEKTAFSDFKSKSFKLPQITSADGTVKTMTEQQFRAALRKYMSMRRPVLRGLRNDTARVYKFAELLGQTSKNPEVLKSFFKEQMGLSMKNLRSILGKNALSVIDGKMWRVIDMKVNNSSAGVGRAEIIKNSFVSETSGEFLIVAKNSQSSKIKVIKVPKWVVELMGIQQGKTFDLEGLKKQLIKNEKINERIKLSQAPTLKQGKLIGAMRVGGRILLFVGVAADIVQLIYAKDKLRVGTSIAGGWIGGLLLAGAWGVVAAPSIGAGPLAWIVYVVGGVVSFITGYFIGSKSFEYVYELIIER